MFRILATLTVGGMLLVASDESSAKDDKSRDPGELVCKKRQRTGTRFATKLCLTRQQWMEISERNQRDYSESRDRPVIETRRDL